MNSNSEMSAIMGNLQNINEPLSISAKQIQQPDLMAMLKQQ